MSGLANAEPKLFNIEAAASPKDLQMLSQTDETAEPTISPTQPVKSVIPQDMSTFLIVEIVVREVAGLAGHCVKLIHPSLAAWAEPGCTASEE
ncbi:hypothetical protein GCM10009839_58380 [Catenulispora yoronensis]|uniref:Uncharacterized protein n=1 Tax=Catenulispora yoronensis TaxID=450799 RepID=A0ABN2V045_9ACTN